MSMARPVIEGITDSRQLNSRYCQGGLVCDGPAGRVESGSCPKRDAVVSWWGYERSSMQPNRTGRSRTCVFRYEAGAFARYGTLPWVLRLTSHSHLLVRTERDSGLNVAALVDGERTGNARPSAGETCDFRLEGVRRSTERCSRRGRPWTLRPPRRPATVLRGTLTEAVGSRLAHRRHSLAGTRNQTATASQACGPWAAPRSHRPACGTTGKARRGSEYRPARAFLPAPHSALHPPRTTAPSTPSSTRACRTSPPDRRRPPPPMPF